MESNPRHKTGISATTQITKDSSTYSEAPPNTCEGYGILSFLALCHRLELPYLPITWEARRGQVGEAGQAKINQSLVNAQTSFVFKRFKLNPNRDKLRPIVQEVAILTHPDIRNHPHILPVQGFCWEIDGDDGEGTSYTIRPVLVFPKSEYGDLRTFFKTNEGHSISILDRLKLGADIGVAMRDMHANGIVHGDLSTSNVLVFKATCKVKDGVEFVARVIDFGFSNCFREDGDQIYLRAGTRPWPAPESRRDYFDFSQMVQMDVYSYGLLCLWLLFGATSLYPISCPEPDVQDPDKYISFDNPGDDRNLLEKWKGDGDKILEWAQYLLARDPSLSSDIKKRLSRFFGDTLSSNPVMRAPVSNLVPLLAFDRENDRPPTISFTDWERKTEKLQVSLKPICFAPSVMEGIDCPANFIRDKIKSLVTNLYTTDFRVRIFLATELKEILALQSMDRRIDHDNAALQLALCYQLGFINEVQVPCAPLQSMDPSLLANEIQEVRESSHVMTKQATLVEQMCLSGEFQCQRFGETYREKSSLSKRAEEHLKQEIKKTSKALDPNDEISKHWIVLQLMSSLADTLADRGEMQAALHYREQVVAMSTKEFGKSNPITLSSLARLASLYRAYGRYSEAARIQQEVINIAIQILPDDRFFLVREQNNLAQTLKEQGELVQAEQLQVSTIQKAVERLGPRHRDTFAMKGNLASIYFDQSKFFEAEKLERDVLKLREDLLGENHVQTRYSLNNLGTILSSQGRHKKAASVQEESRRRQNLMSGEEEDGMSIEELINGGHNSQRQQQLGIARIKIERALELSRTTWGETHPTTLTAKSNLATLYQDLAHRTLQDVIANRFLAKANTLLSEVNTVRSTTKDVNPEDQVISTINLASNYVDQHHPNQAVQLLTPIITQLDTAPHIKHYALNAFGRARRGQGRLDEAERIQWDLFKLAEQYTDILGPTHRITMIYLQNLAATVKKQGRLSDAIALAEECYRRRLRVLGPDDDDTKEVQDGLQAWRRSLDTT